MHYAREEAVQFANFSAAANRATTSAERNSQMQLRMATAQSLVMLYSQWVEALHVAIELDPESPSGLPRRPTDAYAAAKDHSGRAQTKI